MKPPAGSLIAFATDAGQTALDGDTTNGLYTEELLRHLLTPGLTIEQVFKRTRAAVLERSDGGQIPAEYSRLVGDDIFLAGPALAAPAPAHEPAPTPVMKAEALPVPSQAQILNLAKTGMAEECADALLAVAEAQGAGAYAAEPLALLLERAKEDLKEAGLSSPQAENASTLCMQVLRVLPSCLPPNLELYQELNAKAHNRRGDALVLLGRAEDAIPFFDAALALTPADSYILYNRGRAFASLGLTDKARADFTAASSVKFNQPKARKLAQEALEQLKQ